MALCERIQVTVSVDFRSSQLPASIYLNLCSNNTEYTLSLYSIRFQMDHCDQKAEFLMNSSMGKVQDDLSNMLLK